MRLRLATAAWWGPPKKFDRELEERRVSWLELFYDLVYVIAISRITHHLSLHISLVAFFEYTSLFFLIFWGWVNGSLYHDLHGNEGLRTRLMTLWQMMIIAALAITVDQPTSKPYFNITVVFIIMQLFITYQWWSVGFYDRSHRQYNLPYTILYLTAAALMALSLFVAASWLLWIFPLVIICNYSPPFIAYTLLRRNSMDINLTSSMYERLGLFAIIVFGEVVLGIVNGVSKIEIPDFFTWLNFAVALSIVFSLWWIFFTLVSNRVVKSGFINATKLELLYVPTLLSLGLIAVSFNTMFIDHDELYSLQMILGSAIATFLICISLMLALLEFPEKFQVLRRPVRISLYITAILFLIASFIKIELTATYLLMPVLIILGAEIMYLNSLYYRLAKDNE